MITYGLGFALVAVVLIMLLLLRNYRNKVRSNKQISQQKNVLEEKNEEIIGSINYAKRLQDAILPTHQKLIRHFPKHFVWYRPKDIVAGDFYWMHTTEEYKYFAVADCTGHGVPGALVSIVCSNALNQSTKEFQLHDTGLILDRSTELVQKTFSESEQNVNDGMDIALVRIGEKIGDKHSVQYSGAYNSLWVVTADLDSLIAQFKEDQVRVLSGNEKHLVEIKADRQPVGYYEKRSPFKSIDLELLSGDVIYMSSDGFGDQFGGSDQKKYKASNLKRFILGMSRIDIEAQRDLLEQEFEAWKGSEDQIDDVCVAGILIK